MRPSPYLRESAIISVISFSIIYIRTVPRNSTPYQVDSYTKYLGGIRPAAVSEPSLPKELYQKQTMSWRGKGKEIGTKRGENPVNFYAHLQFLSYHLTDASQDRRWRSIASANSRASPLTVFTKTSFPVKLVWITITRTNNCS
jgi:hypothetical protein